MDNYLQINLRRVLKNVDFGTFYKVAKSRPEIFDVLTAYEFSSKQTCQILRAFANNLSLEQIKSCATPDYSAMQMEYIYNAYLRGFSDEQMSLLLNTDFIYQAEWIIKGFEEGIDLKKIKLYAKPEFGYYQIEEIYLAIKDGLNLMKLKLIAKPDFTVEQMSELRLAFASFESELDYKQVKSLANPKLSAGQMAELRWAYDIGFTIEQVERIIKEEYTIEQIREILNAYSDDFTNEQMAFILNPKLDERQMYQVREAVEAGVPDEIIAIIANGEYSDELMEIIIGASNYGVSSYVQLLLNPEFDVRQAECILECCDEGLLSIEQIKFLAKPQYNCCKMYELARWFKDDFSIEQVNEYADKFNCYQLEKIRYGLKKKLEFMDLWVKPEFGECQMQEIICAIENGFTKEQLLTCLTLNPYLSAQYMTIVRQDIETGIPIEKVALYANSIDSEEFEKTRIKVLYEEIQKLIK